MISVSQHTDYTRLDRATWGRPLGAAVIDAAGCQVLGIRWDQGDHSILHRGERAGGCVYPVTLEPDDAGGTVAAACRSGRPNRSLAPCARLR